MENNVDALQLQVVKESKNEDEEKFIVKNAELEEQSDKERAVGGHEENTNRQLVCFKRKIDDIMQDGNREWNIDVVVVGDDQKEVLPNSDKRSDWRLSMPLTEVGAEYVKKLRKKRRERVKEQLAIPGEECSNNQTQAMGESNNDMYKEDEYSRNINLDTIGGDQKDTLPNNDKNINKNAIDDEQDEKLLNDDEGGDRPSGYFMPSTRVDNGDNGMPKKKKKKERVKEKLRILEHGSHQNHAIDDSEGGSCKGAEYPRRADQINFSLMPSIELGVGDKRNMKKKKRERIRGEIKNPEEAPSNDKNQALCLSKSDICIKDDYPRNKSVDHRCDSSARLDEVIVGDGQKLKKKNRVKKLVVPEGELINVEVTSDNKRDIYKEDEYLRKVNTDVDYVTTEDYAKVQKKKIVKEKRKIKARGCERNAITGESTLAVEVDRDFVSEIEDILRPIRCYGES